MYQATITDLEAGQRLDKYLHRILPNARDGFLHKMLRKKNITLNDNRADGSEKITEGDFVKIYFAQETLTKFMGRHPDGSVDDGYAVRRERKTETDSDKKTDRATENASRFQEYYKAYRQMPDIPVIYENDHILIADKPAGVLSQKARKADLSLNEWLIGYLLDQGKLTGRELAYYTPSVCNRLDRNTSGLVLCAKSLRGAQLLGELLKERTLHKYYQLYVKGRVEEEKIIAGYLQKDERKNRVAITPVPVSPVPVDGIPKPAARRQDEKKDRQSEYILTRYTPLRQETDKTLLEVELITGKSHQIRAHLAGIGHPLLGDYKYGDRAWNEKYRQQYGVQSQLLHAYKVVFPKLGPPFVDLSGRTFLCEPPEIFGRVSDSVRNGF